MSFRSGFEVVHTQVRKAKAMKSYPNFRDLERSSGIIWRDLSELEPRLEELLWRARQACANCRRWSDVDRLFSPIRHALVELVGFGGNNHRHRLLGSPVAYEVAYWKLYDAVAGLLSSPAGGAAEPQETQRGGTEPLPCGREPAVEGSDGALIGSA
jgi:hypothetical protein